MVHLRFVYFTLCKFYLRERSIKIYADVLRGEVY